LDKFNIAAMYEENVTVHVDKERRGATAKSLWRWIKRRAAVEPSIGHLKQEHRMDRMDRNRLKGKCGDVINTILSAAGMNFRKLIRRLADFFAFISGGHISEFHPEHLTWCFALSLGFPL